jgi:hypothetical protein
MGRTLITLLSDQAMNTLTLCLPGTPSRPQLSPAHACHLKDLDPQVLTVDQVIRVLGAEPLTEEAACIAKRDRHPAPALRNHPKDAMLGTAFGR